MLAAAVKFPSDAKKKKSPKQKPSAPAQLFGNLLWTRYANTKPNGMNITK